MISLLIEPTMCLSRLAEHMSDEELDISIVQRMRDLLIKHQDAYEWRTIYDVEDVDWFRMLNEAAAD